ncbi:MAG: hypothetical protein WBM14_05645 [Terracidiphilus sp.]|jgi:hypothetical protein
MAMAIPAASGQSKADQAAFDARLGNAHFSLDGDNYLVINKEGGPSRIDFDEVGGFNWFNQNGEYFADIIVRHNGPRKGVPEGKGGLEDILEIAVESAGPSVEVRHVGGLVGDAPNRVMYYQEPYGPPYSGEYYKLEIAGDDDSAVMEILELTDTNLKLKIKGTGTLGERRDHGTSTVTFEAVINLRRTPFVKLPPSQVFGETCDPTLYDRTAGAEYRSPTDCETKFERHIGYAMVAAVKPVTAEFEKGGWHVGHDFTGEPRTDRGIGIIRKQQRYRLGLKGVGDLELRKRADDDEAGYQQSRQEEAKTKCSDDSAGLMKAFMALQTELKSNDYIAVYWDINSPPVVADSISYKKPLTMYTVAAGGLAFSTNDADENADGEVKLSPNETFVYLGPVKQTTVKNSDGSSTLSIRPTFDPKAPALAVQDIKIMIECAPDLAAQVVKTLDFQKLQELIYKPGN